MLKNRFSELLVAFSLLFILGSCKSNVDTTLEDKKKENDEQIQKYLADNKITAQKTESGLYYTILQKGTNIQPVIGDSVVAHYVLSRLDGTKVDSTSTINNQPLKFFMYPNTLIPGFLEGISLMKEGEKGLFLVPSHLAYSGRESAAIPPYSVLKFDVQLVQSITEHEQIDNYITRNKLSMPEVTQSGVRVIKTLARPDSAYVDNGKTVSVKYTGKLLNGKQFDSNASTATTFDFVVGAGSVVKGWDEGFTRLRKGEKAILLFPSTMGYGAQGQTNSSGAYVIYPYAPLVFEVEVVNIK